MPVLVRPLSLEDVDALRPLDESYALLMAQEPLVEQASVSFYSRSGHSFVLEDEGEVAGFLLAQAIWDGRRPAVAVRRLVVGPGGSGEAAREALLEAVTKSSYDSGVYHIVVEQPEADGDAVTSLAAAGYSPRPVRVFGRVLGSRSGGR
jgi:hypothetical protein